MTDLVTIGFKADTSGLTNAQTQLDKTAAAGKKVDTSLSSLTSTIGALGAAMAALGTARLTSELIDYSDAWKGVTGQIRQVTESEAELNRVRSQVLAVAKETRSELGATVELYTALSRSTSRLGLDSERQLEVTRTLNNLFLSSGKSASESAGAIRQLGQALESGALRGDEFNSVAEGAPRILDALSQSLGMARGELREFAATGGITAGILVEALEGYSEQAQKMADQTEITFGQSMTVATANVTEFVGGLTSVNSAINSFGGGIVSLSENLDALTDASIAGAGVLGGIYAINAGKAAAANIQQIAAAKAAAAAELNKAKAAEATAAAELAAVRVAQQRTAGFVLNTQAMAALTAAETKHTAALAAVSAAQATATTTATALAAAWRFMLGPWGALITAVGLGAAVYTATADSVDELTDSIKDNNDEVDRSLTLYDRYINKTSEARAESLKGMSQEALQEEFDKTAKRVELYEERLERLKAAGASLARISDLETRLKLDREQLEAITKAAGIAKTSYELLEGEMLKLALSLDPALKASKSMEEGMLTLNDALAKGLISSKQYGEYVQKLKEKYDPATKAANDKAAALKKVQDRLNPLSVLTRQYYEELRLLAEAGDIEGVRKLSDEYWAMADALEGVNDESAKLKDNGLSDLLNDVDSLSYGFSNLGNVIADSFGDAAAQLNNFAGRMNEITKQREELTKLQAKGNLTIEEGQKVTEKLNQLNQDMYATQLGAIGGVLGASKTMFKEQSKEREVLHRLEMGFMVAEMALAAERAVINASAAIASAATAPFPIGFAAAASMTALMAGVLGAAGVMFSSSSGGYDVGAVQESQGTGTEFGDSSAKADSVIAIQERFEDIQIDQLSELRGIRDAMQGLTNGIEQLAMDIVGTGVIGNYTGDLSGSQKVMLSDIPLLGGAFSGLLDGLLGGAIGDVFNSVLGGLFGKTKKKLVDEGLLFESQEIGELIAGGIIDATYFATIETTKKKLFGLSKKTSTKDETTSLSDEFSEQLGLIFNYLADSVSESITLLGIETENAIGDFMINIGKISFKDMTGEEIQAELEAVFSQQGDLIAKYMWPQVTEYQKLGEGALETLMRVAQEFAVFNDAIDNLGLSLGELEPEQVIATSQALMDLMGGLEEFTESVGAYYDEFFTEQEKMDDLGRSLAEVFADLNIAMPESRGEFRMLVESLDLTTEAGRALFATLMEIAPSFAEFLDGMEDLELEEAARKAREAEEAEKARQDALNSAMRELERAVQVEKDRARAIVDAAREVHEAETDRIDGLIDALNEEKAVREQALSDATSMLQASFSVEKSLIQAASNARIEALNGEITTLNELKATAESEYQERIAFAEAASTVVNASYSAEIDSINAASALRIEALNEEIAAINALKGLSTEEYEARLAAAGAATQAVRASYNAEINAINEASNARIESLNSEIDAIELLKETANDEYQARFDAANQMRDVVNASLQSEISAINEASSARISALNEEIAAINQLKGASTEEYQQRIANAEAAAQSLTNALNAEITAIRAVNDARIAGLNGEIDAINALMAEDERLYNARLTAVSSAEQAVNDALSAEIAAINEAKNARLSALNDELGYYRDISRELISLANALRSESGVATNTNVMAALQAARSGDFSLAQSLSVPEIGASQFGSAADLKFAQTVQSNRLLEIAGLASDQASVAERQLQAIEHSIEQENANAAMQIDKLQSQVDALLGVDSSVMSLASAMNAYNKAQSEANELQFLAQQNAYAEQIALLEQQIEESQASAQQQERSLTQHVNAILGVNNAVMSVEGAIAKYQQAQAVIDESGYNAQQSAFDAQIAILQEQIQSEKDAASNQIGILTKQVNALLGIDSSVISLESAIAQYMATQSAINEDGYNSLIASYDEQIALIEQQIAQDAADTKQQVSALAQQMNALLGIDDSVLSVADAVAQYAIAQAAIDKAGYDAQQASFDEQIALIEQQIIDEQAAAVEQVSLLTEQMNALLGIDDSVLSVEDAIAYYADAQAAIDEEGYRELIASYDEQIAALNEQIAQEEANTQAQLDALDEQLNTLLGIDNTILGLQAAIEAYQFAKADLDALGYDDTMAYYQSLQDAADAILEQAEKAYNDEIDRLDAIVDKAQSQIDKLNGINDSVMSVEDAIMNLTVALIGAGNGKGPDDDIIIVTPVPVDTWATMGGDTGGTQTISNEVVEVLESIARHTATSANNSTRLRTEGQYVRIVE